MTTFDPYRKWLGIPTKDQPPNHYRLLSLELFESDPDVIEGAADRVMGFLRQYQSGEHAAAAAKLLNEVAMARLCLLKASTKSQYDAKLREQSDLAKRSNESDADQDAFAGLDLDKVEPIRPAPSRPTKKKKSSRAVSNTNWVPLGIIGAVIVVAVIAFVIPRQSTERMAASNTGVPSTDTDSSTPAKPASNVSAEEKLETVSKPVEPSPSALASTVAPGQSIPPANVDPPASPNKNIDQAITRSDPSIVRSIYLVKFSESASFKTCHNPTLLETPKGLIAAYTGGSDPNSTDVSIWVSRFVTDRWTAPIKVGDGSIIENGATVLHNSGNPVLFRYPSGKILLFYRINRPEKNWIGMWTTSYDEGVNWSKPEPLPEGHLGPTRNQPYLLADGSLLCGSSREKDGSTVCFEWLAADGRTWTKTAAVNDAATLGAIEPALIPHGGPRWQAIGRTRQAKKIFEIWSEDDGKTWGPMTLLNLPNSSSSVAAIRLKDGRFAMVYNHSTIERTPLNVAISTDGKNWDAAFTLEDDDKESASPAVIQTTDGFVHLAYGRYKRHIRHVMFDPGKVRLQPMINGEWPKH